MAQSARSLEGLISATIRKHFDLDRPAVITQNLVYPRLYTQMQSSTETEEVQGVGAMSPDTWDSYSKSGQTGYLNFSQGFTKTFAHVEFPARIPIKKSLIKFGKVNMIDLAIQKARTSAERKREADGGRTFVNAFTAGASAGADGVALCSASHPASLADAGTVFTNTGTSAPSVASVKDTIIAMREFKDDRGQFIYANPNEILCDPDHADTFYEILKSMGKSNTAERADNPRAIEGWTIIPWVELSGTNNWFMMDSTLRAENLMWFNVENIAEPMIVEETTTDIVYELLMHYSLGAADWRFVFGHNA